jgi:hypothetical protein
MAWPIPVGRVACVSAADLAAIAISEHAVPRAVWWLPLVTLGGGVLVLAWTFWLMWWLVRWQERGWRTWRRPAEIPPPAPPAVGAGYVLRIEPGWPRSQWPRPAGSRTAITDGKEPGQWDC